MKDQTCGVVPCGRAADHDHDEDHGGMTINLACCGHPDCCPGWEEDEEGFPPDDEKV